MAKTNGMKNLKSRKLYLQVYDEIKGYAEKNHLMPEDKLPSEMKVCGMLGVSRNVLGEAIRSLGVTGTVCSTPGVETVIQEFNIDFFLSNLIYNISDKDQLHKEIEEPCRMLELGSAKDTCESVTSESLESLTKEAKTTENLFVQIKQSRSFVYDAGLAKADTSFHKILFQTVDNHLLKSVIEFFWTCGRYYKVETTHSSMGLTMEKHLHIYNAIKARDYQKYYDAVQFRLNVRYFKR